MQMTPSRLSWLLTHDCAAGELGALELRPAQISLRAPLEFPVARTGVANYSHVPCETRQVDQQLAALRRAKTGEVSQALVRPVLPALDTVHTFPEPEWNVVDHAHKLHHRRALGIRSFAAPATAWRRALRVPCMPPFTAATVSRPIRSAPKIR